MRLVGLILLGPLAVRTWWGKMLALALTLILTVVTQVGGLLLWPIWALAFRAFNPSTRWQKLLGRPMILLAAYLIGMNSLVPWSAHYAGRTPLPSYATDDMPVEPLHLIYPLLGRNYVRFHARDRLIQAAQHAARAHPGLTIQYLDTGFPFPWPPLLPHLSHSDGQKVDIALAFAKDGEPVPYARSPIGYWGFAKESRERCQGHQSRYPIPLRWDFAWLQPLLPDLDLDLSANRAMVRAFDKTPGVCTILLEPTLHNLLPARKLRANSCNVARHDDHLHLRFGTACE